MDNQREHDRHVLLFYFRKVKNPVQARKKFYEVLLRDALVHAGVAALTCSISLWEF